MPKDQEITVTFTGAQGTAMAELTLTLRKNGWRVEVNEVEHKLRIERPPGRGKLLFEMTDEELKTEYEKWESHIKTATSWSSGLAAASEFRTDCVREMYRRKKEVTPSAKGLTP